MCMCIRIMFNVTSVGQRRLRQAACPRTIRLKVARLVPYTYLYTNIHYYIILYYTILYYSIIRMYVSTIILYVWKDISCHICGCPRNTFVLNNYAINLNEVFMYLLWWGNNFQTPPIVKNVVSDPSVVIIRNRIIKLCLKF